MKTIYEAKRFIRSNIGNKVDLKLHGIRNKVFKFSGVITECYGNVFIVKNDVDRKCISYVDVLIGNVVVTIK